jgi:hypothetical protein
MPSPSRKCAAISSGTERRSNGFVTITPGSPSDHVNVTLPNPGTKLFARLKVTQ